MRLAYFTMSGAALIGAALPAQPSASPAPPADPGLTQVVELAPGRAGMSGICHDGSDRVVVTSVGLSSLTVVDLRRGGIVRRVPMPAHLQDCEQTPDGFVVTAHDALPDTSGPSPAPGVPPNRFHGPAGTQVIVLDRAMNVVRVLRGDDRAFFNGIARVRDFYLIGDTIGGRLWKLDLKRGTLEPWLADPLALGVAGAGLFGGANGVHADRGMVYFGSRDAVYRIGMTRDGRPSGTVEPFAPVFHADDFDFARDGTLYIPTGNALMRVDRAGAVTKAAELGGHAATALVASDGRAVLAVVDGGADGATRLVRLPIPPRYGAKM